MANETSNFHKKLEEENKLTAFYEAIVKDEGNYTLQERLFMQLLNTKIIQVEYKENRSRKLFRGLGVMGLVVSALTTVLLGLKSANSNLLTIVQTNTALTASALTTLLVGVKNLYDVDNYYFRIKTMLDKLKILRYRYVFDLTNKMNKEKKNQLPDKEMDAFIQEFNSIVGDGYWEGKGQKHPVEPDGSPEGPGKKEKDE
ncbi:MAG: DUF4231 domain-containing protein [Thermoanaerobaculia bacterium]|nr:DUF4231 domain-containing protein [Thermoanaerobaculia bacterium]